MINTAYGLGHFGRCQSKFEPWFGGEVFCYVNLPTTCTDVRRGKKGKTMSAQACADCSMPENNVLCRNHYNTNNIHENINRITEYKNG